MDAFFSRCAEELLAGRSGDDKSSPLRLLTDASFYELESVAQCGAYDCAPIRFASLYIAYVGPDLACKPIGILVVSCKIPSNCCVYRGQGAISQTMVFVARCEVQQRECATLGLPSTCFQSLPTAGGFPGRFILLNQTTATHHGGYLSSDWETAAFVNDVIPNIRSDKAYSHLKSTVHTFFS